MSAAITRPTTPEPDRVTTLEVGTGGLAAFVDLVPRPPGRILGRDGSVMSVPPSFGHERGVGRLDVVVRALGDELEIARDAAASTPCHRDDLDLRMMPDRSYHIAHQGALAGGAGTVDFLPYPPRTWSSRSSGRTGRRWPWSSIAPSASLRSGSATCRPGPSSSSTSGRKAPTPPRPRSRSFPFLAADEVLDRVEEGPPGEPDNLRRRGLRARPRDELAPRRAGP